MALQRRPAAFCAVLVVGVMTIAGAFTASATPAGPPCQTKNVRTGIEYKGGSAVTDAITNALAGDTITIWGTCFGNFAISKDLTLRGQGKNPTLDGNKQGRVLRINSGTTTIRDLTITNGQTAGLGGGIYVVSAAVLVNVLVTGNTAGATQIGGGIEADLGSSLTLIDSTVRDNTAGSSGGIDMFRAKATLIRSTVTGNHATRAPGTQPDGCGFGALIYSCAGGVWNYQGTLALIDSTISGNSAAFRAGGLASYLRIVDGSPVSGYTYLSGTTSITSNTAADQGGGIWANDARSVAAADGSAAYKDPISGDTLPAWTGSVSGNAPDQCFPTLSLGTTICGA